MILRPLGSTGEKVPAVGQGTWLMGGGREADRAAVRALRLGLDLGMTLLDTAEMYGNGHAETLVGEAIRGRSREVFLVTKVLPAHARREGVLRAAEGSLRRLGVEAIDLYLLHWPSGTVPVEETLGAMEELRASGKVRHVGVSNFDTHDMTGALEIPAGPPLVCNQVLYHPGDRGVEWDLLPACARRRITLMAYSPFGHGALPDPACPAGRVLEEIARHHRRSRHQVVLNWLARHPGVVSIPKAVREEHVRDNAGSLGWEFEEEELAAIDRAFPPPAGPTPLGVI